MGLRLKKILILLVSIILSYLGIQLGLWLGVYADNPKGQQGTSTSISNMNNEATDKVEIIEALEILEPEIKIPDVVKIASNINNVVSKYSNENTIYSDDNIQIYATRIHELEYGFDKVAVELILNNKTDKDIVVRLDNTVVNGYNVVGLMATRVEPGQIKLEDAKIINRDLYPIGVDSKSKIDTLDLVFNISIEGLSGTVKEYKTEECHIENTTSTIWTEPIISEGSKIKLDGKFDGIVLGVLSVPVTEDEQKYSEIGQDLTIYVQRERLSSASIKDKDIRIESTDTKINGKSVGIVMEARVFKNEKALRRAMFTGQYLRDLGLSTVKNSTITTKFNIIDNSTNEIIGETKEYKIKLK